MKDTEVEQRLGRDSPPVEASADVMPGGDDERVAAQDAVARADRRDAAPRRLERLHRGLDHAEADRLLKPPAMRRWWRGQQLEGIGRQVGEAGRIRGRGRACFGERWSAPAVQISEGGGLRKIRDRDLLDVGLDPMQLRERLGGDIRVIVADLFHANHRHASRDKCLQLAGGDGGGDKVARSPDAVNIGVRATGPPGALNLQAILVEREAERLDRLVQLQ